MDEGTQKLIQTNPLLWAHYKGMNIRDGIKFSLKGMPYLADIVNCDKKVMSCKKGAQVCMTTTKYIEAMHACYYRKYDQNVLYMMPSEKSIERLSKVAFNPLFDYNRWVQKKGDTNTTLCKEINGRSIVMVGAKPQKVGGSETKDTDSLRSVACDCVMRDEIDLMDQDMVYMSKQRLKRSRFGHQINFGTPTYPDYGIDALYNDSDQRKWQIKCGSCGKYTCLVDSFPNSIILKDGKWIRACIHCQTEIFVQDGHWVADNPDHRYAGFWIDGLLSPYADLEDYMYDYNRLDGAKMSEFMRSTLGVATTEAENQLSKQDVLDMAGTDALSMYSDGDTVMGCDVGTYLHYVIGIKTGRDTYEILTLGKAESFGELHDIAQKMHVKYCVIDAMPETHKIKEFAKAEPYAVSRAFCTEHYSAKPKWDAKEGTVKANRNEWMDKVHEIFTTKKIRIPRFCPDIDVYSDSLTRTAKTIIENPDTGIRKPRWIKLSGGEGDHYYLSTLYFLLAASRASIRSRHGYEQQRFTKQKSNYHI